MGVENNIPEGWVEYYIKEIACIESKGINKKRVLRKEC